MSILLALALAAAQPAEKPQELPPLPPGYRLKEEKKRDLPPLPPGYRYTGRTLPPEPAGEPIGNGCPAGTAPTGNGYCMSQDNRLAEAEERADQRQRDRELARAIADELED